jgi:phage shock protein C
MKRMYRSDHDKKLAGVAGGIGEYMDIDPTILRIIFVVLIIFTGIFPGVLVYLILALVMPKESEVIHNGKKG